MDMNKNRHVNAHYRETLAPPPDYRSSDDDIHPRVFRGVVFWSCLVILGILIVGGAVTAVLLAGKNKNKNKNTEDIIIIPPPPPASPIAPPAGAPLNYSGALAMALRFYDAQKSGKLPADNPIPWRGDSAIFDGRSIGWSLDGGYYDAGDHMKFAFPMAFSMTVLAWSIIDYPAQFKKAKGTDQALESLRWGVDWLLKSWNDEEQALVAQVGNATADHECWERAEDMNDDRPVYFVTPTAVGSDLMCEASAALAAASIAFQLVDPTYSAKALNISYRIWNVAYNLNSKSTYATYSYSLPETGGYYLSSNYSDEFLWAASWLYRATIDPVYKTQFMTYATAYEFKEDWTEREISQFSWNEKMLGARINLLVGAELGGVALPGGSHNGLAAYKGLVETSMCRFLFDNPLSYNVTWRTNGQLLFIDKWSPNQYAAGAAYLAHVYADHLNRTNESFNCSNGPKEFTSTDLRIFARYQVDYMLGKNPELISYMVGWGDRYPQQVHHSGASITVTQAVARCGPTGDYWLNVNQSNPHILYGALVGGPNKDDKFNDTRANWEQTEPSMAMQSAFVAALAAVGSLFP